MDYEGMPAVKCPERVAAEIRTHKHSTLRPYTMRKFLHKLVYLLDRSSL